MLCACARLNGCALSLRVRRSASSFSASSPFPHKFSVLRHFSSTPPPLASMAANRPKDEAYLSKVIPKRIQLFESIQAQQLTHRQSFPADPIKITLPDGTVKEGKKWVTSPLDVAREISKSLASNALISQVNGVLWDMGGPWRATASSSCSLSIATKAVTPSGIPVRTFSARRSSRSMVASCALGPVQRGERVSIMMHFMVIWA
ncbi:hypothetical protein I3760_06G072900 [Carya illinoinensis]|nr:hypothetical protein I3760_06G072900 [Carya illinoinensis]